MNIYFFSANIEQKNKTKHLEAVVDSCSEKGDLKTSEKIFEKCM